jgi:hypothetical protein
MAAYSDYPVELAGEYQERVNRVLWLIKWQLVIPHAIVLWFLSIPTILTIPVAWVAIIIMGRYPSFLWGYHTGLLRWTWRVNFYSYGAGATDRYPPFSFQSRDDYPADFNIEYPETLSRLSTLFRWLLVIPHWIIIYFLGAIADILVFFALVIVLFSGRYPESLFDIIMGMNRWVYRVNAYGWLLVDEYPPFSFD